MLETRALALHVMPTTVPGAMRFERAEVGERFRGRAPLLRVAQRGRAVSVARMRSVRHSGHCQAFRSMVPSRYAW